MVHRKKLTDPWHCSWCSYKHEDFAKVVEHENKEHCGGSVNKP